MPEPIQLFPNQQVIESLEIVDRGHHFYMTFEDGNFLMVVDDMQLCCESRWIDTDDDLEDYVGATYFGLELKESGFDRGKGDVQFVELRTSNGPITLKNYNSHNGYYDGWSVVVKETDKDKVYLND